MRDEYIPAFLELAKAMTDKTLLADLQKYQDIKSESDASFKANEKRVVELQFDRNQLENEKVALLKDRDDLNGTKLQLDDMSKKTAQAYQDANKLKQDLTAQLAALDDQRASIAKEKAILVTRDKNYTKAESILAATQAEYEEKLAKLKAVVG